MRTALHGLYSGLFDWKEITVSAKESTTTNNDDWGGVDYDNDGDEEYVYDEKYRRGFPSLC